MEQYRAGDDKNRRQPGYIEAENLRHQRRPDICSQHYRQRRRRADQSLAGERGGHQTGRGAALQHRRDPHSGGKRLEPAAQIAPQRMPKTAALGPGHAGADHAHAPQQQGDRADQIYQDEGR